MQMTLNAISIIKMVNSINHTISNWIKFALAERFVFLLYYQRKHTVINWICVLKIKHTHTHAEWHAMISWVRAFIHSYTHWFIHLIALYIVSHGDYYFIQSGTNLSKYFTFEQIAFMIPTYICHLCVHPSTLYRIFDMKPHFQEHTSVFTFTFGKCSHSHRFLFRFYFNVLQSKLDYFIWFVYGKANIVAER